VFFSFLPNDHDEHVAVLHFAVMAAMVT